MTETYHVLRHVEGGPVRKELLAVLKLEGIKARGAESCYVGHTAITVEGTKRQQQKAKRIIFG